jgi:hypothetical protein
MYGDRSGFSDFYERAFEPEVVPVSNFKIKWPEGYWKEYDTLAALAKQISKSDQVNIVVLLNGKYQVRAKKARGAQFVFSSGPESHDRLLAWNAFIELTDRTNGKQ